MSRGLLSCGMADPWLWAWGGIAIANICAARLRFSWRVSLGLEIGAGSRAAGK